MHADGFLRSGVRRHELLPEPIALLLYPRFPFCEGLTPTQVRPPTTFTVLLEALPARSTR